MKIFAIREDGDPTQKDLAYLLYYEVAKRFYIELPENADPWDTPLLLSSFAKKGEMSVNSYWSQEWVRQRIVPTDRQNISQLLRENKLRQYDEFDLLMLSMGRCAQDDYYLVPIEESALPKKVRIRFRKKLEDIVPLENYCLLAFFRDGAVKKCELKSWLEEHSEFGILLKKEALFQAMQLQIGGYGVTWDVGLNIDDRTLYTLGKTIPLSLADFRSFVVNRVVNSSEAAELLGCSRQNIDNLAKRGKLQPIKASEKNTLYLKSEVLKRNWQ